ncbi:MAG: hypothetical protein AB2536_12435 [Candidatus Thiodiazotropha endolucinida]
MASRSSAVIQLSSRRFKIYPPNHPALTIQQLDIPVRKFNTEETYGKP